MSGTVERMTRGGLQVYTGIHSTVPEKVNPMGGQTFEYDAKRDSVFVYLSDPKRRGEWRTAYRIAEACGYDKGGTQEQLRKAIKEINYYARANGKRFVIVSSTKGFMYVDDPNAIKVAIQRERARQRGLSKSIGVLIAQYQELGGELSALSDVEGGYDE